MALIVSAWNPRDSSKVELFYPDRIRAVVVDKALVLFDGETEIDGFAEGFWTSFTREGWPLED